MVSHQDCPYWEKVEREVEDNAKKSESEKQVNNNKPKQKQLVNHLNMYTSIKLKHFF